MKAGKMRIPIIGIISVICIILFVTTNTIIRRNLSNKEIDPELARAMKYEQFEEGSEKVDGTDNVKFSAFFLRDINDDGMAERIKGTAKEVGKEDDLYMELNVLTEGYLKNANIQIQGTNFYLKTNLVKDEQLKDNYISNHMEKIEFNDITSGTQKLLMAKVRSGDYTYPSTTADAIGDNINNYSRNDNKIILTGTYVGADGIEKPIHKVIDLTVDWYSTMFANITTKSQYYKDIQSRIDDKNNIFTVEFQIETQERNQKSILSKNHVEGILPDINGYKPLSVSGVDSYDETTGKFVIEKTATVDEQGIVTSKILNENTYKIQVKYPLRAYESIETDTVTIAIPVSTYYEAYNNPNPEFQNLTKSNIASGTLLANYSNFPEDGDWVAFSVEVEKSIDKENDKKVVSKRKPTRIYNGLSSEEKDDRYRVRWKVSTGSQGQSKGIIMKETKSGTPQLADQFIRKDSTRESMENVTKNVGIGFAAVDSLLNAGDWIKVYDDETGNLMATFTNQNWNKYTADNPYLYETPVRHIRVETNASNKNAGMTVYCIKELDDEYITTHYTREQFDDFQYIESTLSGYVSGEFCNTDRDQVKYEAEYATASIEMSNNSLSTQTTEKNNHITITAQYDEKYNQVGWVNGSFLIKLPKEILTAQINHVQIDKELISLVSYELVNIDGINFVKINTQNKEQKPQEFKIMVDIDLTPDPRITSSTQNIELYATNEILCDYQPRGEDIYDVNDNLNTTEIVLKETVPLNFIAPNSLLTNETISDYDGSENVVVSPQIADLKYRNIDNKEAEATMGIQIRNNYNNTISETTILGKIPFKNNTYVLSGGDLESQYTTSMVEGGIKVPEELEGHVRVYYSEKETPTKDLTNADNGWKMADKITNWNAIKTYLIDFEDTIIYRGKEYIFYYTIKIPNNLRFNEISYGHHGVYFCLDTENGKYRTQTEPSKVGLRVAEKYNLELIKYQSQTDKLVAGATYCVKEVIGDEVATEGRTAVTNAQGKLTINGLYTEKTYQIEEIKTQEDYELNTDKIRFTTSIDSNRNLVVEKTQGTTKEDIVVTNDKETPKIEVKVEDEVKAKLKVTKKEKGTDKGLGFVYYQIKGKGFEEGKIFNTDANGNVNLNGLHINETYTLQETKATGYYLANPITFKMVNNNGTYEVEINEGEIKENTVTEENHIPTLNMTLEDEKIPTYDLAITKVGKTTHLDTTTSETEESVVTLAGARFKLYKDNREIGTYTTNANGQFVINGLYQYVEGKEEKATYTLREVMTPTGYSKIKDITFKVEEKEGKLEWQTTDDTKREYDSDNHVIRLQIEDNPIFKLIKKDGETGEVLPNVKFAIFDVENGEEPARDSKGEILGTKEIINGKEYYTLTTNASGEITADLKEGKYKAVEVQADEKYQILDNGYYFSIGSNKTYTGLKAEWAKVFPVDKTLLNTVIETSDGGYLASVMKHWSADTRETFLYKLDENGNIQWENSLNGCINEYYGNTGLIETTDGDYIVLRGTITKIGKDGKTKWEKRDEEFFEICSIAETKDGGFLLVGETNKEGNGGIIKYNIDGEKQWEKIIKSSSYVYVQVAKETKDGGYIVGGFTNENELDFGNGYILTSEENTSESGFIAKYNNVGEVEWAKWIEAKTQVKSIIETSTGDYLVGGYTGVQGNDSKGIIIKYGESGEIKESYSFNNRSEVNAIIETKDGGYAIGGIVYGRCVLNEDIVLDDGNYMYGCGVIIKYNTEGKIEWAKEIGSNGDSIYSIIETNRGDYLVGGRYSHSYDLNLGDGISLPSTNNAKNMLIKFNMTEIEKPVVKPTKTSKINIKSLVTTQDGGYVAGGCFSSDIELENGQTITNNGELDGIIIKYNRDENIEWTKVIQSNKDDTIYEIIQTQDGGYLVLGYSGGTIDLGNESVINQSRMLIKYSNQMEVEWVQSIPASSNYFNEYKKVSIKETKDGGYLVGSDYTGNRVDLGNGVVAYDTYDRHGGMIAKYNDKGEAQWVKLLETSRNTAEYDGDVEISSAMETKDGGYIVSGNFYSGRNIHIGNGQWLVPMQIGKWGNGMAMIIKYDKEGNPEWNKTYPIVNSADGERPAITEMQDGGYVVGYNLITNEEYQHIGVLIKYSSKGEAQWAKEIKSCGRYTTIYIHAIKETKNGELMVIGKDYEHNRIELGNGVTLNSSENGSGLIIKYNNQGEAKWARRIGTEMNTMTELEYGTYMVKGKNDSDTILTKIEEKDNGIAELQVENKRKEFKITTKVEKNNDIAGGSISGENENPYEIVKYGDSNTKEIKMTPEEGYKILKVTINGEECAYEKLEDGSYIIPTLTQIKEDKNIVVTYGKMDNTITIHKVDETNKQPLEGATFTIEQVIENVVGELNQKKVQDPDFSAAELFRCQMHYFNKVDGKYIATNSNAYEMSTATANTTANSLMPIDLTGKKGNYRVEINAEIDSEEGIGIGYATVSSKSSIPSYDNEEGRFMYITGKVSSQNYSFDLEGGSMYYLHVGYKKGESDATYVDNMIVNDVKIYPKVYHFIEVDGKYQLSQEVEGKVSYIPIDLTSYQQEYMLKINAEISSGEEEIGYAMITESEEIPNYDAEKTCINLSGKQEAKDYTTILQGGKKYYLHLGYNGMRNVPLQGNEFIINKVEVQPYNVTVTTNGQGKASIQIPFGTYKILETKAPEGYLPKEEPTDIEFSAEGKHEVTIENTKTCKVIVHHYLKGTTQSVAKDELREGKIGEQYVTAPQTDLEGYTLETDGSGKYRVPENAAGRYTTENIEVIYEYVRKQIPLTVHHYIEGTTCKVPLANGTEAQDLRQIGQQGDSYTTSAIAENELSAEYELAQIPTNHRGIYEGSEINVIYFYKKVERNVTLTKYQEDGTTPLAGAKFTIQNKNASSNGETIQEKVYTTNTYGEIELPLGYGIYEVTEIEAPKGYVLPENPTTEITIDKNIPNKQLKIINEKEKGTVIVHYYIEGTEENVPLADGTKAEDFIITGEIGSIYATKELSNVSQQYELKERPVNASGLVKKDTTEVIYYYKEKRRPIVEDSKLVKTSEKQNITKLDEKIPYTITYTGVIDQYKGDAVVTIVDQLPYEIEIAEGKSDLAGGIYDAENKTITWVEKIEGIDTVKEGKKHINITKKIVLTYKDLDSNAVNLSNRVKVQIRLLDSEDENPIEPGGPGGPSEPSEEIEEGNDIVMDIFTKVDVKLMWIDAEEKELRPEKLILQVKKDGEVVASKEVEITKDEDSSTIVFEKLPKYDENKNEINYTVDETVLPGDEHQNDLQYYKKTIEGFTITNTMDKTIDNNQGKVIVEHIDKNTGNVLKTVVKVGNIGDSYQSTEEEIEGYILVESPENPNIVITQTDQTVKYYYEPISLGVIERHIDVNTHEILYQKTHAGEEGDFYKISPKTFDGYDLVTTPTNAEGEMTEGIIEVEYYYSRIASVKVEYLDKETKGKIAEDVIIHGHENDDYTTEKKDIEGYVLDGNPTNEKGKMQVTKHADGTYETQTVVQYYYTKKQLQVIEEYVNIQDNTVIESIKHIGTIGDKYEIHPKEIEGYELVQSRLPDNNKGIMTEEVITVRYYCKKKAKVMVKYLNQLTKEEIHTEEINGYVGDSYQTKEKQWEEYDLIEIPKNASGKMTADTIEVKYYYKRKAQVEIQYLEKETNAIISEGQVMDGYVGEKYKITRKGVAYYKYLETIGNEEGIMTKDKIIIKYYFEKQEFNLRVDTWISNVDMNGVSKGGKTLATKDDIYKLDIHRKQLNTAEVKVTYHIQIKNVGELEGSVTSLTDVIPSGFSYHQEDNETIWKQVGGKLTTTQMKGQMIKPGEHREMTLVLRWNKGEENLKEKVNRVTLSKTESLVGFEETNLKDNVSKATMLITIATGMSDVKVSILVILAILVAILGMLVYGKKRYSHSFRWKD